MFYYYVYSLVACVQYARGLVWRTAMRVSYLLPPRDGFQFARLGSKCFGHWAIYVTLNAHLFGIVVFQFWALAMLDLSVVVQMFCKHRST